jgi:macrophage erythroblast attacher
MEQAQQVEQTTLAKTKSRIQYLQDLMNMETIESEEFDRWSKTRLNHLLVDYLSRRGYHDSAQLLAQESSIHDLVDLDLFLHSQSILESLLQHQCQPALQWCIENKSSLKKIKSRFEFQLRLQEYIELVRQRQLVSAIQYSKKYLVGFSDTHLKEIQQAAGLLAFDPNTTCPTYQSLYCPKRWTFLASLFQEELFQLHNLTKQPMLFLTIQAGLTALKTHSCQDPTSQNINCPVCSTVFQQIANQVPYSHHVNSSLVCRISGRLMDETNPPLVLPNGYCYSTQVRES